MNRPFIICAAILSLRAVPPRALADDYVLIREPDVGWWLEIRK